MADENINKGDLKSDKGYSNKDYQEHRSKKNNKRRPNRQERRECGNKGSKRLGDVPAKNDWQFYALSEQVASDIGSIPYNVIPGVASNLDQVAFSRTSSSTSAVRSENAVPNNFKSLMNLRYTTSCGVGKGDTTAINMAATKLYTYTRHANSGAKNYDPADEMMYVLAMSDIYSGYFEARRAIGLAGLYSIVNRNLPDVALTAAGIDVADLRANIAQYRGRLNIIADKINSFAVPKYFKIFLRRAYIASLLFSDSDSVRGQYYMFNRMGYYKWDTTSDTNGTKLAYYSYSSPADGDVAEDNLGGGNGNDQTWSMKFGGYLDILEAQLNALFLDTDANTMSGDILKAFSDSELYQVDSVPTDYIVTPTLDEDILAQIENSYCACVGMTGHKLGNTTFPVTNLDITQKNQLIEYNPSSSTGFYSDSSDADTKVFYYKEKIFNSHKDNPDYKDNLEWSRLITVVEPSASTNQITFTVKSCGAELLHSYSMLYMHPTIGIVTQSFTNIDTPNTRDISQFDWHPFIYNYRTGSQHVGMQITGDIKKYTIIPDELISRIHDSANAASFWGDSLYNK